MGKPNLSRILQIGGMAAGAMIGGLPGAMAGGQLGGTLGGMAQGGTGGVNDQDVASANVIDRRMNQLKETPQAQIAQSINSLKDIDDPMLRQELAKPLLQAQYIGQQKGYG